jgi:hypothetical protein
MKKTLLILILTITVTSRAQELESILRKAQGALSNNRNTTALELYSSYIKIHWLILVEPKLLTGFGH